MRRLGFTLIELLVVVAIIALLIAILLPSLSKARDTAKLVACGSNQRQIVTAMMIYGHDNHNMFPFQDARGSQFAKTHALTIQSHRPNWIWSTWPYINKQLNVLSCPSIEDTLSPSDAFYPTEEDYFGYVMNGVISQFGGNHTRYTADIAVTQDDPFIENGAILRPHWAYESEPSLSDAGWSGWMRFGIGTDISFTPHEGKVLSFLDGHSAYVRHEELTSRQFGLLINGQDAKEPEVSGYNNAAPIGTVIR
ncbi:prepilin-type N-terminal cleavage/methylation domain-containing protein [Planctomycetales bacterium ZRK34]|nr:prepilin-type N-terminal cleavage/methylation domain-containing protein [Planctomycetales bacterium ZRK34]